MVAIALHGDFSVVLDNGETAPIEVIGQVEQAIKKGADSASADCTQFGSDGIDCPLGAMCGCRKTVFITSFYARLRFIDGRPDYHLRC